VLRPRAAVTALSREVARNVNPNAYGPAPTCTGQTRHAKDASILLSPRNDVEPLDNDETEMDRCEPADTLKQDIQKCL